jgi:hypothetical protein
MAQSYRRINIPVVLGGPRHLWSENGKANGIIYKYCADHCLSQNVHCGHDVEAIYEPIFAATDGLVKFAGYDGFYTPNYVAIEPIVGPFRGEYHIYGHLREAQVTTGQTVKRGQRIGTTGTNCRDRSCTVLDVGNEHLHWERRGVPGFTGCSLDPDAVLTSPNANGEEKFQRDDNIRVSDGPLRLRQGPGVRFAILQTLPNGTELCVTGDPHPADGFIWSPVLVENINRSGWVADQFCTLFAAGGCARGQQPVQIPVPEGAASPGQPVDPHPDDGPSGEELPGLEAKMPVAKYDGQGVFIGVTFPEPPVTGGQEDLEPWSKG